MSEADRPTGSRLVLSPQERLVANGPAEEFEAHVQALFREGYRRLIVDLRSVPDIDSAGVRALVRGHTTAQRLGGSFRVASLNPRVRRVLELAGLDAVFNLYDTLDEARRVPMPWRPISLAVGGAIVCGALVWGGLVIPELTPAGSAGVSPFDQAAEPHIAWRPFLELLKLTAAALVGVLVTAVHQASRRDNPLSPNMQQAQVLLCISGAMMMIIIGNSLARAFGIAGAASIVRFRTLVDDPKDVTILFLLMGLGMSLGLGAFAVGGLATIFLCICIVLLDRLGALEARVLNITLTASSRDFPSAHVESVFARYQVVFEPRNVSQGGEAEVKYQVTLPTDTSLEELSEQLMGGGKAGLKSVSWSAKKS
jgi:anti-anti-sigma factor